MGTFAGRGWWWCLCRNQFVPRQVAERRKCLKCYYKRTVPELCGHLKGVLPWWQPVTAQDVEQWKLLAGPAEQAREEAAAKEAVEP